MKRIAIVIALLAFAAPALAQADWPGAARDIVDQRLRRFVWQVQALPDGTAAYLHPLAGESCVLFVHQPSVSRAPERDLMGIGSSFAQQAGGAAPTPSRSERRSDGTTILATSVTNSRDEGLDLYMVVGPPPPRAGLGRHQVQLFAFRQRPRSVCGRDPTIPRIMQALGSRPAPPAPVPRPEDSAAAPGADAASGDPLAPHRAAIEAYSVWARQSGALDPARLGPTADGLRALAGSSSGDLRLRALAMLGRVHRLRLEAAPAIETLTGVAAAAEARGLPDVAFDAWIEIARARANLGQDHGATSAALERAAEAAGDAPTTKQRFALADEGSRLMQNRGEAEAALVEALNARSLAPAPVDRYVAEFQIGAALASLANRCTQGHALRDSRSEYENDPWDACRRAFDARDGAFGMAADTAETQGWAGLARIARERQDDGTQERMLFEFRSGGDTARRLALNSAVEVARQAAEAGQAWGLQPHEWGTVGTFAPRSRDDVFAYRKGDGVLGRAAFMRDATILASRPEMLEAQEKARAGLDAVSGGPDASSLYDRGRLAEIRGDLAGSAEMFARAATLLDDERESFFDPRRRGTVIESRSSIIEALATRLLSLDRDGAAFDAFESARARGLGELAQALAGSGPADRAWLARLLRLEARASAIEAGVVREVVASARFELPAASLAELDGIRAERRALLRDGAAVRARLQRAPPPEGRLAALERAAASAGVPVLLYWTTSTGVIMWHVGPRGTEVRSVLLPQETLERKVRGLIDSASSEFTPFDETAARELYLFLVAPFDHLLDGAREVMIIPQGPLVSLPFETLLVPESNEPLVQRWAVSYAPNAAMALAALRRAPRRYAAGTEVAAVVDVELNDITHEVGAIAAAGFRTRVTYAGGLPAERLPDSVAGAGIAHFLVHGEYDTREPLLSSLHRRAKEAPWVLATDLIGLAPRGLWLAVLSSCEGGRAGARPSGEIYGIPWALLAGGVETVVLSRWQVKGASNGDWMRHFYAALGPGGASPAEAAAAAMRAMRAAGLTHPYHWAAMQVTGR